jgi:low temperature requirement protein LtrA
MISVAAIAIFIHDGMGKTSAHFALSYAAARTIITFLWLRAAIHVKAFRNTGRIFVAGFSLSILSFVVSAFIPTPYRFFLWGFGLFCDLFTPVLTLKHQALLPKFSTSKLPERFGLLMIIMLGESVIGVVNGIASHHDFHFEILFPGVLGIVLVFCLWWVYFDFVARRYAKQSPYVGFFWNYLHLFLVMGITAVGAGITNSIIHKGPFWLLPGASGLTLITIGLLEITLKREKTEPTHPWISPVLKIASGLLIIGIFVITGIEDIYVRFGIPIGFVLVQIVYGVVVWFRKR